jgi:SNF2 family DNA or RNA helicase
MLLLLLLLLRCVQATSRIWRYGQMRRCFVYHLLYAGTVEQQLYDSTLAKQELFERVSDGASQPLTA